MSQRESRNSGHGQQSPRRQQQTKKKKKRRFLELGHSRSRGDEPAKLGEVLGNFINSHSRRATPWGLRRPEGSRPIVSLPSLPTLADERRLGVGLITGSVAWVWAASIAAID